MPSIEIRPCAVGDVLGAPNLGALLAEYAAECGISALSEPAPQWDTYRRLEAVGVLHVIGAFDGDDLVGFLVLLVSELAHYAGVLTATSESFFVADRARKGGAGLKLLREAERIGAERGATGFLVSAPAHGRLAKIMPRIGFFESNRVFFRKLSA